MRLILPLLCACALALSGCARNLDGNTYSSGNTVGKVVKGTVISARPVTIKDTDDSQKNALGGLAGGALGGIAGSSVGGGTGKALATVGGAIVGAMAGAAAEDALGTQQGVEYVIELDAAQQRRNDNVYREEGRYTSGASVEDDIKSSIKTTASESDYISVIQTDAQMLAPGQPVLVIYHDDRPRVVAR